MLLDALIDAMEFGKIAAKDLQSVFKSTKLGIEVADEALQSFKPVELPNGMIQLGEDLFPNQLYKIMKSGDLEALVEATKLDMPVLNSDVRAFERLSGDSVYVDMKQFRKQCELYRKTYAKFNVTLENMDKMSKQMAKDLEKVESQAFKYFKEGFTVTTAFGVVIVGVGWVRELMLKMNGCHMLKKVDGRVVSCKLPQYSCDSPQGTPCGNRDFSKFYNVSVVCIYVATALPVDNELRTLCASMCGIESSQLSDQLPALIETKFNKLHEFVHKNFAKLPVIDVCGVKHPKIENGVVPACRMCDPSAVPTSTQYLNPSQFAANLAFECVVNCTAVDAIAAFIAATDKNIWDAISGVSDSIKHVCLFGLLLLVVVFVIGLIVKFYVPVMAKLKRKKPSAPLKGGNLNSINRFTAISA